jgi:hypothetical protein
MFIESVKKPALVLPADADYVFNEEEFVSCRVKLPEEVLLNALGDLMLLVEIDERAPRPVWYIPKLSGESEKQAEATGEIQIKFAPGRYYFAALHCPEQFGIRLLGVVTITQDSAGKTLEIQPLTEEDKKQLPAQDKPLAPAAAPAPAQL